jgi:hypothetical protein
MVRLKYLVGFGNSFDSSCKCAPANTAVIELTIHPGDEVDVAVWSMIEEYTALICACLPSLRPLLVQYIPSLFKTINGDNTRDSLHIMAPWKTTSKRHNLYGPGDGPLHNTGNDCGCDESTCKIVQLPSPASEKDVGTSIDDLESQTAKQESDVSGGGGTDLRIHVERKIKIDHLSSASMSSTSLPRPNKLLRKGRTDPERG